MQNFVNDNKMSQSDPRIQVYLFQIIDDVFDGIV
jgi:hypothetical protein